MRYLHLTTLVLFLLMMLLGGDAALFSMGNTQKLRNSTMIFSSPTDAKKPKDYPKVISPLVVQDVDLKDVFVFEGTYPIKYHFNISELVTKNQTSVLKLLPPKKTCEQSDMLKRFCNKVSNGVTQLDGELLAVVEKLTKLSTKSKASGLRVVPLKHLPQEMKGNGTSDFMERLLEKEASAKKELNETITDAIAEIVKVENHSTKKSINKLAYKSIGEIVWQQRARVTFIEDILTKCQRNHVPIRIFNPEAFHNDVDTLWEEVNKSGFTLAVPEHDKDKHGILELPIADCSVKNEQLHITVNVPVRQLGNWTLITAAPIPFSSKGEKCRIFPENVVKATIAGVDNEYAVILKMDYNRIHNGLYLVRQNDPETQHKYSCWFNLLKNSSVSESLDVCQFHCRKNDSISIMGIGENKFIISGANRLNIRCGFTENSFPFPDYGSFEIDLPLCKCVMTIHSDRDQRKLKSPRANCNKEHRRFPEPVHVIPSQWADLQRTPIANQKGLAAINSTSNQLQREFNSSLTPAMVLPTKGTSETGHEKIKGLEESEVADGHKQKSGGRLPLYMWVLICTLVLFLLGVTIFLWYHIIYVAICKRRPVVICKPRLIVKQDQEGEDL